MLVLDHLFSIANWGLYKIHKRSGKFLHSIRSVTQAYNETFEDSDLELKTFRSKRLSAQLNELKPLKASATIDLVNDFTSLKVDDGTSSDKTGRSELLAHNSGTLVDPELAGNPIIKKKKKKGLRKK